jgi:uncharacterized RDD family membrane protein YckC
VFSGAGPRFVAYIIDAIIITILNIIVGIIVGLIVVAVSPRGGSAAIIGLVIGIVVDATYFIQFWTTEARATLGMRILNLQVGNAFDGRRLDMGQAFRRWVALGSWISAAGITTSLAGVTGLIGLLWALVLLVTTTTSPTKQGLHDRFANTAIVRPDGSSNSLVVGCMVIVVAILAIILLSFVALILLGSQVSTILSQVGTSV